MKATFALNACDVCLQMDQIKQKFLTRKAAKTFWNINCITCTITIYNLHENLVRTLFPELNKLPQEWGEGLKQGLVHKTASCKWSGCEEDGFCVIRLQNGFITKISGLPPGVYHFCLLLIFLDQKRWKIVLWGWKTPFWAKRGWYYLLIFFGRRGTPSGP